MIRRICLLTAFAVVTACLMAAQTSGRISGTVVIGEDGAVADHVNVCTSVSTVDNTAISCRIIPVDNAGHFQLENVKFGSYGIFAVNEDQGYFRENQSPGLKITVTAEDPWPNVSIRLRPRGDMSFLTGSITDKMSGKAIEDAWIHYITLDNGGGGGNRRTEGGKFSMAAPTEDNLLIYASARGYKGWVYTDTSSPIQAVVRLASGERRVLDIALEPLPKTSGMR